MISMTAALRRGALPVLGLILGAGILSAQHDPRAGGWAHDRARLQPDARVVWGSLDNGLRYAFLPHPGVSGRVSMRLLVLAGSLDEEENERGLAHFLEHMAFNGTENFAADDMVEYFQRLGMEFGSDVNAVTTPDYTAYGLEFNRSERELVREGFLLFRDFADRIEFDPKEIDEERGVILSELRMHDGLEMRIGEVANRFFFRGLRFPERNPIGRVDIIRTAGREDFQRFYRRLYRPDQMVLVAVGDLDVEQYRAWTREHFSDIPRPTSRPPERQLGQLPRDRGPRATVLPILHFGSAAIRVAAPVAERIREDSLDLRRQEFQRKFATALFANRLNTLVPGAGGASAEYIRMGDVGIGIASLSTDGEEWDTGVVYTDRVIRFTHDNGFEAFEIDRLRRRMLLQGGIMRAQAATMDPAALAESLVESIVEGRVYLGFEREKDMEMGFLRELTGANLRSAFRDSWPLDRLAYFVGGEVTIPGGASTVVSRIRDSRRSSVLSILPPVPPFEVTFRPVARGAPGKVTEKSELPDFGARLMRFENNVRFNFLRSEREPGLVRGIIRVGNGLFERERIRPGLREFALDTVLSSGTDRYRAEQVQMLLSNTMLDFSFDVEDHDAFTFRGACTREDLETFFGLVADFLHSPRFSRDVQRSVQFGAAMARMSQSFGVPDGLRAFQDHLFAGDGRFAWGVPFDYHSLGITHVRDWLGEALLGGYVEVSLIGDISEEEATAIAARTFGTLPPRREIKKTDEPEPVRISARPGFTRLEFMGEDHQAAALGMWPVMQPLDLDDRLGLLVVSRVLEQRMRLLLRERLGLAYAPVAGFIGFPEYPAFALIQAEVDCSPDDADRIAQALDDLAEELALEGMTENEFLGAINPVQGHLDQALRTNSLLLERLLKRAQERPETVDEFRAVRDGALRNLTLDRVNELASSILSRDNARTAAVVPKLFVGLLQIDMGSGGEPVIGRPR